MKVQEFIEIMNSDIEVLRKELNVKKYISVMKKQKFAMDVIAACTDEIDGFISVDRFKMNIYFDMQIIKLYTNLEVASNFNEMVQQYDALYECNMLVTLVSLLEDEYDAMWAILEQKLEELLAQNSIEAQVVKIVNKINQTISAIGNGAQQLDPGKILPEGTDITDLLNVVAMLK